MSIIQAILGRVTGATVVLTNRSVSLTGQTAVGLLLRRDGGASLARAPSSDIPISGEWVASGASATVGDAYEVFVTPGPGIIVQAGSDALSTWLRLNSDRLWRFTATGWFDVQIRPFGGGATLANARITVTS